MSLSETLIKYLDRKFDRLYKQQNNLLVQQNQLLQGILDYVKGPANQEQALGTAEEDGIDDEYGQYDTEKQAKEQIKQDWRDQGYPDDITQLIR